MWYQGQPCDRNHCSPYRYSLHRTLAQRTGSILLHQEPQHTCGCHCSPWLYQLWSWTNNPQRMLCNMHQMALQIFTSAVSGVESLLHNPVLRDAPSCCSCRNPHFLLQTGSPSLTWNMHEHPQLSSAPQLSNTLCMNWLYHWHQPSPRPCNYMPTFTATGSFVVLMRHCYGCIVLNSP